MDRHPMNPNDTLPQLVLDSIKRATAQQPADCRTLAMELLLTEETIEAAVEALFEARLINRCSIQRAGDDAPWCAIWPTGLPLRNAAWTGNGHHGLFAGGPEPLRLPARPDPARDPRPDLGYATGAQRAAALRQGVAELIRGRAPGKALSIAELADKLNETHSAVAHAVNALVKNGWAAEAVRGSGPRRGRMVWDPAAETPAPARSQDEAARPPGASFEQLASEIAQAVQGWVPEPEPTAPAGMEANAFMAEWRAAHGARPLDIDLDELGGTGGEGKDGDLDDDLDDAPEAPLDDSAADGGAPVRFALWDDGALSIHDDGQVIQLDRGAVRRLALLLGVPREEMVHGGVVHAGGAA